MRRHASLFLALVACGGARSSGPPRPEPAEVDRRVDPCLDFYAFADNPWRAANPIPDGRPQWGRRLAARAENRRDLQAILTELAAERDHAAGTPEQQLGDLYAACLDETAIQAAGLTPLAPLLAEIEEVRDLAGLALVTARLHDVGVPALFVATGVFDYHDPARIILHVLPGARLPDAGGARVAELLGRAGLPAADADAVVALEGRLAEVRLADEVAADPAKTDHAMSAAQLAVLAPRFPWDAYFRATALPRLGVNVTEPAYLTRLDRELEHTPVAVWKRYLAWRLLDWASPWVARGAAAPSGDRAAACVETTEALLGEPLGRQYAARHFPPAAKAKVEAMVETMRAVLIDDVRAVAWMAPATREQALAKLRSYEVHVGYPDVVTDTSAITVRRDDFFASVMAARRFAVGEDRRHLGQRVARSLWGLPPSSSAAYIDVQLNLMVLPAGFLQAPAFDLAAPDAENYGALGTGIAHDMTHAIDTLGADFDAAGRPTRWWTDADRKGYDDRAACVIAQYDGYLVEPGLPLEGKRVAGEAIGDLAGVSVAYRAFERSRPGPAIGGFTPAQQFFLAWGRYRGVNEGIELMRKMVTSDSHPTARHRVNGPLVHTPAFREAFACPVAPAAPRCRVW
jgi:putative endopeptidase